MKLNAFRKKWEKRFQILATLSIVVSGVLLFPANVLAATVPFSLVTSGTSHIGWMFSGSTWDSRDGWNTTAGYTAGQGDHLGSDYYADDWNKTINGVGGNVDCGQEIRAPFAGNVIFRGEGTNTSGTANGYGYQVIIQADANTNFAWRATHLQKDSMTTASHVNAGDVIGKMGGSPDHNLIGGVDYWSGNSTACHLHSVLYKNIFSNTVFGTSAYDRLRTRGGVISNISGGPDGTFATPFYNDATPSGGSGQSACATFSAAGITFFSSAECTGATKQFTSTGFVNLPDYGWNDTAKSLSVQSGWSARVWNDANRGGATVCFSGTKWDLAKDSYENGTPIVQNGIATISSFELFNNLTCTPPAQSACATFSAAGVTFFSNSQCSGTTKQFTTSTFYNLTDYGFNDASKSMSVQSGKSVRIWNDINRGGATACITNTKWDLAQDRYENGTSIVQNGSGTISSFQLFDNTTCTVPQSACATYSGAGITLWNSSQCTGTKLQLTSPGFYNIYVSPYNFNDMAKSLSVQSGWSARIYEHDNRNGSSRCVNTTMWDLTIDKYDNGVSIATATGGTITSLELFSNSNCTPSDTTKPTGQVTSPAKNSFQKGPTLTLTATASDTGTGVAKVDFYGWSNMPWSNSQWIFLGSDTTAPYSLDWNTGSLQEGTIYVSVDVFDRAGNKTGILGDPYRTAFILDRTVPTGAMTSPTKGSTFTGTSVVLSANASDNNIGAVSKVEFYVWSPAPFSNLQWIKVGEDTTAPYSMTWNISGIPTTYVYATIRVYDKAGNASSYIWDPNWTTFNIQH